MLSSRRIAAALAVCALIGSSSRSQDGPPRRPNIILLLLDDQDAFTPMWEAMPATAAMIRDRGTNFRTALSSTPIGTPGRVTLLTGRSATDAGLSALTGATDGPSASSSSAGTFATELERLGYVNALVGKSWGATGIAPGWHSWCSLSGERLYEGYGYLANEQSRGRALFSYPSSLYSTDFLASKAAEFIRNQADDPSPFFLWLAPTAPHLPLEPAPRHAAYAYRTWRERPTTADGPPGGDATGKAERTAAARPSSRSGRLDYPRRMGSLMAVDEMMAGLRDLLIAQGKWEETVIVLTSDNGHHLGAGRPTHRMPAYEASVRVPLHIAGEGIPRGEVRQLVGLQDVGPTLIELAGGNRPRSMDGESLVAFLRSGPDARIAWRDVIVTEHNGGSSGRTTRDAKRAATAHAPTYRSIRTETHKYIHFAGGEEEVYDLRSDPFELNNLLRRSEIGPVLQTRDELRARLRAELHVDGVTRR